MQAQTVERPVKVESKRSSFSFAPIWKPWQTEGTFESQEDALKSIDKRCKFRPGFGRDEVRSKDAKPDGTIRVVVEEMPAFGAEEEQLWGQYYQGMFRSYLHFRIRPLNLEELNRWLIDSVNRREYKNVKLALESGAVVNETTLNHIISSWASTEVRELLTEARKKG